MSNKLSLSPSNYLGWFGMRRDFCSFLLTVCPCLREYGNISYTKQSNNNNSRNNNGAASSNPSGTDAVSNTAMTTSTSSSSSSSSSSSPGMTSPDIEGQRRNHHLEDSFHFVASRMNAMIVSQPKKSLQYPPHMTIESPD